MTQKLVLFFNSDLLNSPMTSGFAKLSVEFGLENTQELYRTLVERLLTESFPMDTSYQIILASDYDPDMLKSWLGSNWEVIELGSVATKNQFHHILNTVFDSPSVEKALILRAGLLGVDEDHIQKTFQKIEKHHLYFQLGTDDHLVTMGIHRDEMHIVENLDFGEEHLGDLITVRAEHYGIECLIQPPSLIPSSLEDLAAFRENLPKEHYIATKIDQLILDSLAAKNLNEQSMDRMRTMQIDLSAEEEIQEL